MDGEEVVYKFINGWNGKMSYKTISDILFLYPLSCFFLPSVVDW